MLCQSFAARAQFGNSPPTLLVQRTWQIPDDEEIGSVITRVQASDVEGDKLAFDLEKSHFYPKVDIPFTIDSVSGVVKLNSSISDRVSTLTKHTVKLLMNFGLIEVE